MTAEPDVEESESTLQGRLAAHSRWAQEQDRTAATRPGSEAFLSRFDREVDPDGTLPPAERAKRALNARSAYFSRLRLTAVKARRKELENRARAEAAEELEREDV